MLETSSSSSMVVMAPSSTPAELVVCHNSDKREKSDLLYKKSTKMHYSFSSSAFAAVFVTFIIIDLTLLFSPSSLHVHAHIALTYPPARRVDLDFLDNIRTPGPCGMPRGLSPPLELEEGSTFNVTWHLGLLHRGGFKLELLDTNYSRVALLTPTNTVSNNFVDTNPAQQRYTVTLPANFTCDLCTIRLTRQALEWSVPVEQVKQDNADEYLLRSCADVNIVKAVTDQQRCTHRGTWTDGQCICDRFYAGNSCQYENECDRDSDCGGAGHGACIDIQSTSTQQASKMCFCHAGWFGYQCRKESILRSRFFDTTLYRNATVGPDFTLFWRILPEPINEIEMVVYARSQSYVAVGWRPQLLDGQCRAQVPQLPSADLPIISAAAAAAMRAAVESGSPPSPTLMPRMQLPPAAASVGGGVALHPMDCTDIIIGRARGSLSHVADYYTRDRSTPRFDETFGGQQSLTAAYGYEDTTNGFMTVMFRRPLQAREPTDHSFDPNFPLMHFVWSRGQDPSSQQQQQQQQDGNISSNFYRRDELKYHGNSRTARGVANINFFSADAAPAAVAGPAATDSAAASDVQQPPPSPHQQKQPQSPSASLSMPPFYNLDKSELMTLNDDDPATLQLVGRAGDTVPLDRIYQCRGEFKDPVGCDTFDCAYIAKWQYIPDHDSIWFMIQTRNDGKWHGIGFSDDRRMPNTDVIIMWLRGSQLRVSDMWLSDYAPPTPNDVPSIMNVTAKLVGNMLKIEFVRPRLTVDKRMDFQMTDEHCPYFVFPTAGGEIDAQAGVIRKHSSTPLVSEQRICVTTCEKAHEMVQLQMDAAKANELTRGSSAATGAQPAAATRGGTTAITVTRLGNNSTQIVIEPPASHSEASSLFNNPTTTTSVAPIRLSSTDSTTMTPTSSPSSVPNREVDINANVVRSCGGRWKYPTTCELDCDYVASWVYEPETDAVKFLIQTRRIDKWTGIGFSYDRRMPNSDIIYAMARPDGTVSVFDSHVGDAHAAPQIDAHQDITDAIGFVENDLLTVTFTRPRAAHHSQDVSFLDQNHCPYLLFPVYGGNFSLDNNSIQKHEQTPYVSTARICVVPCDTTTTLAQSTVVTTTTPSGFFAADSEQQQQTLVSGPATVTALPSTQTTTTLLNEMLDSVTVTPSPSTSTEAATLAPQQYIGMPPIEGTRCRARFRFPENCNGIECLYVVDWEYLPVSDRIAFLLRSADTARWTGVGFSQHRRQYVPTNDTDSQGSIDMIVAWVDATTGGRVTITDRHVQNGSIIPERDAVQNIGNLGGKFDGPFQLIAFSRPRNKSSTVNGVNFDNQTCAHFVFPIMGGSYSHSGAIDDDSRGVGAPERTPYITERKICVGPCGIAGVEDSPYVPIPINLPLVSSTPTTLVIIAPATSVTPETTSAATTTTSTEFTTSTSTGASTTNVAGSTTTLESSTPDTSTSSTAYISTIPTSSLSPTGFSYDNVVSSSPTTTEIVENLSSSSTAAASSKLSGTLLRNDCAGVFAYPDDCQADECQYQVEWQYDDETQTIRFLINYDDPKTWFGVGFSQERRKGLPTSAIYAYVEPDDPNRVRIMSAHHFNDMPAVRNSRQFLLLEDGGVRNGRVFAQFVRPLTTPNPQDYQWTATGPCPYFYFPIRGGAFDANTGALAPTTTPYLVSGERMCMRPCAPGTFAPNVTTTTVAMTTTSLPTSTTARSGVTIIISDIGSNVTNTNTTTTTLTPSSSSTTSPLTSTEMSMSTTTPAPIIISSSTPETPTTSTNTNTSHLAGAPSTEVDIIASMTTTSTTSTTEQPPPGRPSCVGLFKYPYTCNGADCMYYAQWENVENAPQVRITLLTSAPENWTAIGFSDTRYMPGTDMIYGWVDDSGQLELYDAFATAHQPPQVDLQRNIVRAAGRRQNGLTQITFVRNFVTNDPEHDYQITRTHCPYLVFPVVSGRYDEETKQISKHGATPLVSTERVCLASCYEGPGAEIESSTTSTTEATPTGEPAVVVPAQHRRRPVPNPQHMKPPSTGEETIVIEKLHPVQTTTVIPEPAVVTPSTTPSMMKVMQSHGYTRDCEGEWRYPPRCSDDDCLYVAMWQYIDSTDSINFTIRAATPSAAALARNTWTGIGFGDTKLMPDTEVILGWVHADDGRVVISDRHTELHNGVPLDTDGQSFTEASGRRETSSITGRNFTTLTFMRPRTTDDKLGEDYQFGDYQCPYLKFPVYGGTYEETPGMLGVVRGHPTDRPPLVSADRVCIRSCRQDYPRSLGLRVRLLDELWNDELRNPHSEAYARMKQKILLQMRQIIGDGRRGVADIRLRGLERGSVVALMDILFEPTMQEPTASGVPAAAQSTAAAPYTLDVVEEVKRALHSEMERTDGRLGTLRVDPNAVVIEPVRDVFAVKPAPIQPGTHQQTLSSSTEQPPSDVIIIPNNATNVAAGGANGGGPSSSFLALVIVLPIIGFILLLILLAALYKFYRVYRHRKLRQTHRVTQEQAKAAGWVDYSAVGGNIMSTHHQHHQHNIVGGTNGAHRNAGFDETLTYPPGQSKPPSYRAHPPAASDFIGGPHKNNGAGGVMMMEQHTAGYHLNGNNNNNIIAGGGGEMQQLSKEQRSTTTTATSSGAATPASAAAAQNQKSAVATTVTTNTTSSSVTSNKPLPNAYTTTPPSAYVHTTSSSGSTLADNAGGGGSNLGGGGGGTTQSGGGSGSGNPQDRNVTEFYFVPSQRRW